LQRAAQGGLCGACKYAKLIRSARGSVFVRCTRSGLPKYPRVPVVHCQGFVERELEGSS
jgi:hypothetical protein